MTVALEGGEWSAARPGYTLPPGKTRYPFYRRLGGPQGRSGRAENLVPTGVWSWTVQPIAQSLYWLSYLAHSHLMCPLFSRNVSRGQRWLGEEALATHRWLMIPSLKISGLGYGLVVQGSIVSFLVEAGDSSLPKHPDWLWGPTSHYLVSTSGSFSVSKVALSLWVKWLFRCE